MLLLLHRITRPESGGWYHGLRTNGWRVIRVHNRRGGICIGLTGHIQMVRLKWSLVESRRQRFHTAGLILLEAFFECGRSRVCLSQLGAIAFQFVFTVRERAIRAAWTIATQTKVPAETDFVLCVV